MKKYLYDYINEIDEIIKNNQVTNDIINEHLVKIGFFQHERLIHLLVTITYAIIFLIFVILTFFNQLLSIIVIILMIFLICYVLHYFRLENGVQYLYKQYDIMKSKLK